MPRQWTVELFGGLRVVSAEREFTRFRTRKTAALLAYLCLHPDRLHSREGLADLLWPGCGVEEGRNSLSTALWSLRRQLQPPTDPAPVLLADRFTVGINPERVDTDVGAFREWLSRAGRATSAGERAAALGPAVELYRGELLVGYQEDWLEGCRQEYRQMYRAAVLQLVHCLQETGQHTAALRYVEQAVQVIDDVEIHRLLAAPGGEPPPSAARGHELELEALPLPTGTVTFLLVGADPAVTAPLPFAALVQRHLGHAVAADPPLTGVFACAEDAVACVAALWEAGGENLRIALETGRATPEHGRYYAPARERGARLLLATGEGQTLCSERTASLVRYGLDPRLRLIELGTYQFPGTSSPERLFLLESIGAPPVERREPVGLVPAGGRLPRPPTRFFGREAELSELASRLTSGDDRLITLHGPGGSGKTRLALECCSRLAPAFRGAVWFLPLVAVAERGLLWSSLLAALELEQRQAADPLQRVAARLGHAPALLLVDNAEHLLPECGTMLAEVLAKCPAVRCLVTSRARLGVAGEVTIRLQPLPLPRADQSAAELGVCASVGLFLDRAQAVVPDFQITSANAAEIAALCVRLEGFPLALELAAARAGTLTPAQLAAQLEAQLELVALPRDQRPVRHRSLRAAVAGSLDLLGAEVRVFLCRLAICRGGWDLPAAEAIGADPLAADHLAQLQDVALVTTETHPVSRRFDLLEVLREFAWEQLSPAERDGAAARHAAYFAQFCREAARYLGAKGDVEWFARFDRDLPNVRVALTWFLAHDPVTLAEFIGGLTHYFDIRGAWREGRDWLDRAAAALPPSESALRQRLHLPRGWFAYLLGDLETAYPLTSSFLAHCRETGDLDGVARALYQRAFIHRAQGRLAAARADLEEAVATTRRSGGSLPLQGMLISLAAVSADQGEHRQALALLDEALENHRRSGGRRALANILRARADIVARLGDLDEASRLLDQVFEAFEAVGDRLSLAGRGLDYGALAARRGDWPEAARQYQEAVAAMQALGSLSGTARALHGLAAAAAATGDRRAARLHLHDCLRLLQQLGDRAGMVGALEALAAVDAVDDPEAAVRALATVARLRGATADSADPMPLATTLRDRLGPSAYDRAWATGWRDAECYLPPDD